MCCRAHRFGHVCAGHYPQVQRSRCWPRATLSLCQSGGPEHLIPKQPPQSHAHPRRCPNHMRIRTAAAIACAPPPPRCRSHMRTPPAPASSGKVGLGLDQSLQVRIRPSNLTQIKSAERPAYA